MEAHLEDGGGAARVRRQRDLEDGGGTACLSWRCISRTMVVPPLGYGAASSFMSADTPDPTWVAPARSRSGTVAAVVAAQWRATGGLGVAAAMSTAIWQHRVGPQC
jgi:hypothetical protein